MKRVTLVLKSFFAGLQKCNCAFAISLGMLAVGSSCQAQLQSGSFSTAARADQDIIVVEEAVTLLGLGDSQLDLNLSALGSFEFSFGDEVAGEASVTSFEANFSGFSTEVGAFSIFAGESTPSGISPVGSLTNIVESDGVLVDADFTINTPFTITLFDLTPPGSPLVVFTPVGAEFTGRLSEGFFLSPDPTDGLLFDGDDSTPDDFLVAISSNRTVTAVPEPASVMALLCLGCLATNRRKRG